MAFWCDIVNNQVDDGIIKEGYVELQKKGALGGSSFHSRYLMVKKSGTVDLFEKPPSGNIVFPKETFRLQGDEDIHSARIYKQRYRIKILISGQKKHKKWILAFEEVSQQKSWLSIFRSVHKHIHALARLEEVLSGSNVNTMDGQLVIANAFAECGHLVKADKIYKQLITRYNSSEVHEQYEIFLSCHCNDSHRAEQHFVNRLIFFCVPKEIRLTKVGLELGKICQRIEYLGSTKRVLLQPNDEELYQYQMEYRNIENIWPCYLYSVPSKQILKARKLVTQFLKETNRTAIEYKYEYTYNELEAHAWDAIKQCVDGKRGVVKLQTRLELVMRREQQKQRASERISIKLPKMGKPKGDIDVDQQITEQQQGIIPIQRHRSSKDFTFPNPASASPSVSYTDLKSEDMMDILQAIDYLDIDIDDDSDDDTKQNIFQKRKESTTLSPDEESGYRKVLPSYPRDSGKRAATVVVAARPRLNTEEQALRVLDPGVKSLEPIEEFIEDGEEFASTKDVVHRRAVSDAMLDVHSLMDAIHDAFYVHADDEDNSDAAYDVFPWTLFMLIWSTRRDKMRHIIHNEDNTEHIQVILEFVYSVVRGCMLNFERHRADYTLLLQTLYNRATNDDHEDVKYKMCLSGVRVIGCDKKVSTATKVEVCKFMTAHHWLDIDTINNKKQSTIRKYFHKGLRDELNRIHNALDTYYSDIVYCDEEFHILKQIRTKTNVVIEISTQCHDKIQGIPTWGPRFENKYNLQQFTFVCQHRQIVPIPKPVEKAGDFDECYMLFCLAMAEKLNPCFQSQIKAALYGVCEFEHYEKPIKESQACIGLLHNELKAIKSPKAARILDYCRCVVAFQNVHDLLNAFHALDDKFKICKIVNIFSHGREFSNINNYQYMVVYLLCKHPQSKLIKLICEVRLVLQQVHDLYEERKQIKECFGVILPVSQMKTIQKEIVCGIGGRGSRRNKAKYTI